MRHLALLALLAASAAHAEGTGEGTGGGAPGNAPPAPAGPQASPAAEAASEKQSLFYEGRRFGLQLDAGLPGGLALSGVVRPWRLLRVNTGLGWNYFGVGLKGGLTLVPFQWAVAPTLGFEAGHFFSGDASRIASNTTLKLLLKDIGYTYVTGDVGLEFGSPERFLFFVRAGLSYLSGDVKNVAQAVQTGSGSAVTVKSAGDATASYLGPSGELGFVLFIY